MAMFLVGNMNQCIDLDILKILETKENYDKYYNIIDLDILTKETYTILKGFSEYYKKFKEDIDYLKFTSWFINTLHRNWDSDEVKYYKSVISNISKLKDSDVETTLTRMRQDKLWVDLSREKDNSFDLHKMKELIVKAEYGISDSSKCLDYLSLDEAFKEDEQRNSFSWRLSELQNAWGCLQKQQFYLITAATHTGKSSFLVSEASYWLRQNKDANILYFNNERSEKKIFERFMCSLFNRSAKTIQKNLPKVREHYEKLYPNEPLKIFSAREGKKSMREIEGACALYKPSVVIIDQIDNLLRGNDSEAHRAYANLYAWARDLAVKYDTPVMAVSQYSVKTNEQGNVVTNNMHQHGLFYSRVDKPANTDYMLGIQNVENDENSKRIYLIRAKEGKENYSFVCKFNQDSSIFSDYQMR